MSESLGFEVEFTRILRERASLTIWLLSAELSVAAMTKNAFLMSDISYDFLIQFIAVGKSDLIAGAMIVINAPDWMSRLARRSATVPAPMRVMGLSLKLSIIGIWGCAVMVGTTSQAGFWGLAWGADVPSDIYYTH